MEHLTALQKQLALYGGDQTAPRLPARHHFGEAERAAALRVMDQAIADGAAPAYGGPEEEAFGREFAALLGGGYADAVNSGTTSVFVALRALPIEPFTEIIVGPITDPGGIMPIVMMNCIPIIADSAPDSFNVNLDTIRAAYTERTSAIVIPHIAGEPVDIQPIIAFAQEKGLYVVEDCAQAHGAKIYGRPVGTFGDAAGFSLMHGKHTCTGGQGGIVFTRSEETYWKVRQNSDRGKPFGLTEHNGNCVATLNFNLDEIGCAIGRVQTPKMYEYAARRRAVTGAVYAGIERKDILRAPALPETAEPSYWFSRLLLDADRITCDKHTFCEALKAEGLTIGEYYDATPYMRTWAQEHKAFGNSGYPWAAPEYKGDHDMKYTLPANAAKVLEQNISLYLHENYSEEDITKTLAAINKVCAAFAV